MLHHITLATVRLSVCHGRGSCQCGGVSVPTLTSPSCLQPEKHVPLWEVGHFLLFLWGKNSALPLTDVFLLPYRHIIWLRRQKLPVCQRGNWRGDTAQQQRRRRRAERGRRRPRTINGSSARTFTKTAAEVSAWIISPTSFLNRLILHFYWLLSDSRRCLPPGVLCQLVMNWFINQFDRLGPDLRRISPNNLSVQCLFANGYTYLACTAKTKTFYNLLEYIYEFGMHDSTQSGC